MQLLVDKEAMLMSIPSCGEVVSFDINGEDVKRMVLFSRYTKKDDSLELWVGRIADG